MSIWLHYGEDEKLAMLQHTAEAINTERMTRHLYDLEKMMDSPFAESALQNTALYKTIVCHRQKFSNIQDIDYQTHYPAQIQICPPDRLLNSWRADYENLCESFIYEKSKKTFDELIDRILNLTNRIREINLKADEEK